MQKRHGFAFTHQLRSYLFESALSRFIILTVGAYVDGIRGYVLVILEADL